MVDVQWRVEMEMVSMAWVGVGEGVGMYDGRGETRRHMARRLRGVVGASMRLLNMEWLVKCEMGMRLCKLTAQATQGDICHSFFGMGLVADGRKMVAGWPAESIVAGARGPERGAGQLQRHTCPHVL